jgi:hypothetical protein
MSEEGCHSASVHTTIHFGHHLLFYKDGVFEAGLPRGDPAQKRVSHKNIWMSIAWIRGVNSLRVINQEIKRQDLE